MDEEELWAQSKHDEEMRIKAEAAVVMLREVLTATAKVINCAQMQNIGAPRGANYGPATGQKNDCWCDRCGAAKMVLTALAATAGITAVRTADAAFVVRMEAALRSAHELLGVTAAADREARETQKPVAVTITKEQHNATALSVCDALNEAQRWLEVERGDHVGASNPLGQRRDEVWRCSACGEGLLPAESPSSAWRWNGNVWQHQCGDPQAGHFDARSFGVGASKERG